MLPLFLSWMACCFACWVQERCCRSTRSWPAFCAATCFHTTTQGEIQSQSHAGKGFGGSLLRIWKRFSCRPPIARRCQAGARLVPPLQATARRSTLPPLQLRMQHRQAHSLPHASRHCGSAAVLADGAGQAAGGHCAVRAVRWAGVGLGRQVRGGREWGGLASSYEVGVGWVGRSEVGGRSLPNRSKLASGSEGSMPCDCRCKQ